MHAFAYLLNDISCSPGQLISNNPPLMRDSSAKKKFLNAWRGIWYIVQYIYRATVAHLAEQRIRNAQVAGSIPASGSIKKNTTQALHIKHWKLSL